MKISGQICPYFQKNSARIKNRGIAKGGPVNLIQARGEEIPRIQKAIYTSEERLRFLILKSTDKSDW